MTNGKRFVVKRGLLDPNIHILSFGGKENFWIMDNMVPCGPCSEMHMNLTPEGDTRGALMFMQFNAHW